MNIKFVIKKLNTNEANFQNLKIKNTQILVDRVSSFHLFHYNPSELVLSEIIYAKESQNV